MLIENTHSPNHSRIFKGLSDYLGEIFPSRANAIRKVWKMSTDKFPPQIGKLPDEQREALIATYAPEIYLTMQKYPEQLVQNLLWLTSCDPDKPANSTNYARPGKPFFIGRTLPNWGYAYSTIEIRRKQINYGEKGRDNDKPLFVPINALRTDGVTEELEYYATFRGNLDMATNYLNRMPL